MKKRLLSVLLALSVLMGSMPVYALEQEPAPVVAGMAEEIATNENAAPDTEADQAQDAPAEEEPQEEPSADLPAEEVVAEEITVDTSAADLPDNDELFALYLQQQMYPGSVPSQLANWGQAENVLNADELAVYNTLKDYIGKVARGEVSSTQNIALPFEHTWTYEELGVAGPDDTSLSTKLWNAVQQVLDLSKIVDCLLVDCPAELYWFDKTQGYTTPYSYSPGATSVTVKNFSARLAVAEAYGTGNPYEVDTAKTGATKAALEKAQSIVDANTGKTTYEKLLVYKNEICALTGYNDAAAADDTTPYGDPWQLIYVFDGNPDTTVVCEGYAKAFQYLCDLSGIDCYTVNGMMAGGTGAGGHMWNIVPLDGQNYLVDVTNCDEGTVGSPDQLFLAGTAGSVKDGYTFTLNGGRSTITYTYYDDCKDLYGEGPLTLAATDYGPSQPSHDHSYDEDGFCTCGQYQPADQVDGVYQIANAGNLFWFAALVNGDTAYAEFEAQDAAASAVLTQDIDLQSKAWTPIGAQTPVSAMYTGTFDGQGYAVRNLRADGQWAALFGAVGTGGVVQNLTVSGTVTGGNNVGGLCSSNLGTIRNCCNEATVKVTGNYAGGIAASNAAIGVLENCYNLGTVVADGEFAGGICAYNDGEIRNSYSAGTVSVSQKPETAGGIAGMNYQGGSIQNSYYQQGTAPAGVGSGSFSSTGVEAKDQAAFQSGEVTWLLNGQSSDENCIWRQNLDNGQPQDDYPVLDASHGIVYKHMDETYSNESYTEKKEQAPIHINNLPQNGSCFYGDVIQLEYTGGSGSGTVSWEATGCATVTQTGLLTITGVGEFSVAITKAEDATYNAISTEETRTAQPKNITPAVTGVADVVFNGYSHEPDVTVRDGDTLLERDVHYTVQYSDNVNAGTASVTVTAVEGSVYTFAPVTKYFTITKAAALHPQDRGAQHRYTATGEQTLGLAGTMPANAGTVIYAAGTKEDENGLVAAWSVDADGTVHYTLSGKGAAGDTAVLPVVLTSQNYADTTVRVVLTMQDREVPQASAEPYSKTYDGQAVQVNDLTVTAEVGGSWAWKEDAPVNVADSGTWTLIFTPDDDVDYGPVEVPVEVTITKAAAQLTQAPQPAQNLTYTGQAQTLLADAGSTQDGTLVYSLAESGPFSEKLPTATNAGNYKVWYKVAGDANHEDTQPLSLDVVVGKAVPQAPESMEAVYGAFLRDCTLPEGWQWLDGSVRLLQTGKVTYSAQYTETENYQQSKVDVTVVVSPLDITSAEITLDKTSLPYAGVKQAPDVIRVACGDLELSSADYTVEKAEGLDVGSYTITVTGQGNFTGSQQVQYAIVPKEVNADLNAKSKVYDGTTDAEVSATVSAGIAGKTLTITGLKGTFAQKDVGQNLSVAVDVTQARWDNTNYLVNFPVTTTTASITAADFTFAGVADQSVRIGNGMDTVNVVAAASGVAGETVPGTVQWYSDPDCKQPLDESFLFRGAEGDRITLYWSFSQKDDDNYSKTPVTGSSNFTLVSKIVPKLEAEGLSKVYDGKAVTLDDLPHSADVPGSWSLADGTPELKNVGQYQVALRFTPEDSRNYAEATCNVAVNIEYRSYYISLKLSGNRISAGQALPTVSLVCSGALEGDDLHFDVEPVFTGLPQTSTPGSYTIRWANWQEIADAIYKNPDAGNYALHLQFLDTLTITDATLLPVKDEDSYRLETTTGLTEIPQSLRDAGFETADAVLEEMFRYIVQKMPEATRQNTSLYDVTLYYSEDGDATWVRATEENFPKDGITVVLPYPAGTNAADFDFVVTHMLTVGTPGAVEIPAVTKTDKGLQFTLHSLSPVAVSWKAIQTEQAAGQEQQSAPAPTATPVPASSGAAISYYTCPACGYHDWTATDEGYRCDHCGYLESLRQLSGYGNVQGFYEPESGSGAAASAAVTIAQTGDESNPALWAALALISAAMMGVLFYCKRRNKKTR